MSALNVNNDARRMGKGIYCFAHLLGSKILACEFLLPSQQSYKTDTINSTFHLVGKIRGIRNCSKPVEAESLFPLYLSDMSNKRGWSLSYPSDPKDSVWHERDS